MPSRYGKHYELTKLEMPDIEALAPKMRRKCMYEAVKVVALVARTLAPQSGRKGKGRLSKSISYKTLDAGLRGSVYSKAPHAHLVHDGTAPHPTFSPGGKMLQFKGRSGDLIRGKQFEHPGARAQPFFTQARDDTRDEVEQIMKQTMEECLAEVVA
ncbi:MAG: HK97 gp10 family phage protein [Chloroflexi bacterium]|nr:HK97 gp10 family phage protein [Chloroflexota bacterium]